jgi:polysaccharide biosynthesis transport protein
MSGGLPLSARAAYELRLITALPGIPSAAGSWKVMHGMFEAPRQNRSAIVGTRELPPAFAPAAEFDFQRILSVIWRGKAIILGTTTISLIAAALFVSFVPHRYTATTQILIDPTDLRAVATDLAPASQANDAAVLMVESQVRVLTSDNVLRRVIKAEALDHDAEFIGQQSWLGGAAYGDSSQSALNALKRAVQVKRAERTYIVDVSVTAREPVKVARIANAIAQAYLAEQTDVRSDAARQISQSLSARLNELKERVRQAENRVETYKAQNNILGASGQLVNEQQLSELNNQLGMARARTAAAKARLDQVEHVHVSQDDIGSFPEAVQSQTITALRTQYAEIMRREAEQMTSLGARHPAVIEIQAQAERLRHLIENEVHRIALSARSDYESARANEATLAGNLENLKGNAITTNEAMVSLRELERDVVASRAVYESFLVRARETGEQERLDTKNIRVISRADPPARRSFPPSNTLLAVGALLIGVAAGTGIVVLQAAGNDSAPRLTRSAGNGTFLGRLAGTIGGFLLPSNAAPSIRILATLPHVDTSFALGAAQDPNSHFAWEIGQVLDGVGASPGMRGNPSILVIAADDEDDTVAVALTLAAAAAITRQVLLIDADLERRTLAAIDADRSPAGLIDVAVGRRELNEVTVRDRETNINLVSFVPPNSRRGRRITEADVTWAFDQTRRFDMVIVAAVGFHSDPSTRLFADLVDHIVLVAEADKQDVSAIEQFASQLGVNGRKIRGAVLTGATTARISRPAKLRSA